MSRPIVKLVLCPFSDQYLSVQVEKRLAWDSEGLVPGLVSDTHKGMTLGISLTSVGPNFPFVP